MLCKIADLITEIPNAGDLLPRCRDYLYSGKKGADIIIRTDLYRNGRYPHLNEKDIAYMESAFQFYMELVNYNGLYLHSSAVELDGKAYLFSGPCGMGKSTHTRLWQQLFGESAHVFNDDKPALRRLDGCWYAYGTPWCGKDGINQNMKVPLAGICFLKQAQDNQIRKMSKQEAMQYILSQTIFRFQKANMLDSLLCLVDQLVNEIPVFELQNRPDLDAARLSYNTIRKASEETSL